MGYRVDSSVPVSEGERGVNPMNSTNPTNPTNSMNSTNPINSVLRTPNSEHITLDPSSPET
jgi:hypothetical protein